MSSVYPLQSTFNSGEISPLLAARVDLDLWRSSLLECRNFQVLTHGGLRRRSGTRFVAELRNSAATARLLPFIFSDDQAYVLCLNDGKIRFIAVRGVVGAPYEIDQSYADDDLSRVSYAQFNDISYLAHKNYPPQKLVRQGDTNWTLDIAAMKDGPYLEVNLTATTLTPEDYGSFVPKMTSNTDPSGVASSTGGGVDTYKAFDKGKEENVTLATGTKGFLQYQLGGGAAKICDAYWLRAPTNDNEHGDMPTAWSVQGSHDGVTWITLDTRSQETGWQSAECRYFEFKNKSAYEFIRLDFSGGGGSDSTNSRLTEWIPNEAGDHQTPFILKASSTIGINSDQGFLFGDVGRAIHLRGSDGRWRWARIAAVINSTDVTVRLYGHALPDLSPIAQWALGAFSISSSFPACVELFDERLFWARTDDEPATLYGSRQGDFEDYGVSDPLVKTDGIKLTLLSSSMNEILWLAEDDNLAAGSAGQIRSVGPADSTTGFSATNIQQRRGPTTGTNHLQPLSVGGVLLYVGAGGTKIRELVLGDQSRYVAPELSVLAEHLFKSGIVDWAFTEKPDPTIYAVTSDGRLIGVTYDRDQKILGFARHDLGGHVENVAAIPGAHPGADDLYMVVRRTIDGQTKRYIEVLEAPFDGDRDAIADACFVDCSVTYDGAPATVLSGLDHLEGEEVAVLADGASIRGLIVSGGQITLPVAASKVQIGLPFTSRAVTLPITGPGQDGILFGRRRNVISARLDLLHTGALKAAAFITDEDPETTDVVLRDGGGLFTNPTELRTGWHRVDFNSSWAEGHGRLLIETDEPLPCVIRALVLQSEAEP